MQNLHSDESNNSQGGNVIGRKIFLIGIVYLEGIINILSLLTFKITTLYKCENLIEKFKLLRKSLSDEGRASFIFIKKVNPARRKRRVFILVQN